MSAARNRQPGGDRFDPEWFEIEAERCRRLAVNIDYTAESRRTFEGLSRFYEAMAAGEDESCPRPPAKDSDA
ncbi:hypothetical protein SCD90_10105 [Terrihabitans sp. PJ23]|uniref:Uncharacterized protein n=1 Tax=Terrihabitans rhizophilus TaxID=3092662 RepID=A0ABU4RNJ6_9HYPH|nr:hypothetical protein [Terrihabitans sp. PJ23]